MKISSMETVSSRIDMRVGVAEERIAVDGTGVCEAVGGIEKDVSVGGEEVGVVKTLTEKLQALSNIMVNTQPTISRNHLRGFIALSFHRGVVVCSLPSDGTIINLLAF
jgi:hypothetical protein